MTACLTNYIYEQAGCALNWFTNQTNGFPASTNIYQVKNIANTMFLLQSVSYPEIKDTTGKKLLLDRFLKGKMQGRIGWNLSILGVDRDP